MDDWQAVGIFNPPVTRADIDDRLIGKRPISVQQWLLLLEIADYLEIEILDQDRSNR